MCFDRQACAELGPGHSAYHLHLAAELWISSKKPSFYFCTDRGILLRSNDWVELSREKVRKEYSASYSGFDIRNLFTDTSRAMVSDGEPSEKPLEPEGTDRPSTSGTSGDAHAREAGVNPPTSVDATPDNTARQSSDSRGEDTTANLASEGSLPNNFQSEGGWVPWMFFPGMLPGSSDNGGVGGERPDGANVPQWVPVMFPVQMPMFLPLPPPDQSAQTGGFYAVPLLPIYGLMGMGSPGALKFPSPLGVPVTMEDNITTTGAAPGQPAEPVGAPPLNVGRGVPIPPAGLMQPNGPPPVVQAGLGQGADQRRVIRRFQVGIQLDLLLLLKLAVVVFVFNQDGSKDRLLLLMCLAVVIYLYQTGSLAPILRYMAERAQHIMAPPQQPPAARPEAHPAPDGQVREGPAANVANPALSEPDGAAVGAPDEGGAAPIPPVLPVVEEARRQPQDTFWGFVKELQMLVVGFVTSLLPGFHAHVD